MSSLLLPLLHWSMLLLCVWTRVRFSAFSFVRSYLNDGILFCRNLSPSVPSVGSVLLFSCYFFLFFLWCLYAFRTFVLLFSLVIIVHCFLFETNSASSIYYVLGCVRVCACVVSVLVTWCHDALSCFVYASSSLHSDLKHAFVLIFSENRLCAFVYNFSHFRICFHSWSVYLVPVIYTFNNFQYIYSVQYWIKIIINSQRDNTHCPWQEAGSEKKHTHALQHWNEMINRTEFPMNNGDGSGFANNESKLIATTHSSSKDRDYKVAVPERPMIIWILLFLISN